MGYEWRTHTASRFILTTPASVVPQRGWPRRDRCLRRAVSTQPHDRLERPA